MMIIESMQHQTYTCDAPAKINLRLKVLGRLANGYHQLSMINTPLALADSVFVTVRGDSGVSLRVVNDRWERIAELEDLSSNLVARAVALALDATGRQIGCDILLVKRIPIGAGLGGGSSDGAAALRIINHILQCEHLQRSVAGFGNGIKSDGEDSGGGLSKARLYEVAALLGADVPYLLEPMPAWVGGVGEAIRALPGLSLQGLPVLLVQPDFPLSTKEVFQSVTISDYIEQSRPQEQGVDDLSVKLLTSGEQIGEIFKVLANDLTGAACRLSPPFEAFLHRLRGAVGDATVHMTGSGSCCVVFPQLAGRGEASLGSAPLAPLQSAVFKEFGESVVIIPTTIESGGRSTMAGPRWRVTVCDCPQF